jgi:hypothetical protein
MTCKMSCKGLRRWTLLLSDRYLRFGRFLECQNGGKPKRHAGVHRTYNRKVFLAIHFTRGVDSQGVLEEELIITLFS